MPGGQPGGGGMGTLGFDSYINCMRTLQLLYEKPAKGPWMTFKTARLVSFKMLVSVIMFSSSYLSSKPSF